MTTRPGAELGAYSRLCNAVEGNTTFYAQPSEHTVARWCEAAPADFRFVFKLPRVITHDRRLQEVAAPVRDFLERIEPLGERIGPVQVQLPPGFGPQGFEVLEAFVRRLPRDWDWLIELRHQGWFDGCASHRRLDDRLAAQGIGRVVLDTRPLYAEPAASAAAVEERANKPRLPVLVESVGPIPMIRVIGSDSTEATIAGLAAWVDPVVAWLGEGRLPYVFAHQPDNLDSPDLARRFHAMVSDRLVGLVQLADPPPVQSTVQGALFDL